MQRTVAISVGAVILLGLGAFGASRLGSLRNASPVAATIKPATCADAYRVLGLKPSQVTAAGSACITQTLQMTGELNGAVGQAYAVAENSVDPTQVCSEPKRWDGFPQARLAIVVGKKAYRMQISAPGSSEHQELTMTNLQGHVDLASMADPSVDWTQATGKVTLNADGITGTIDANVLRDVSGTRGVHITGVWACGVPQATTFDSSVPCASFYALNHLQEADVTRMKGQACNSQDLVFSGDISAHLDHAITDAVISAPSGIDGDNRCGNAGNNYDASLKFSIGDESFLLDLYPRSLSDSPIGPGQYMAGSGPFSANTFLWLGHADSSQNGLFVTDGGLGPGVSWYGSGGSFTIASDMKSGTIDEMFAGVSPNHASSTVHITGSWRCAP